MLDLDEGYAPTITPDKITLEKEVSEEGVITYSARREILMAVQRGPSKQDDQTDEQIRAYLAKELDDELYRLPYQFDKLKEKYWELYNNLNRGVQK